MSPKKVPKSKSKYSASQVGVRKSAKKHDYQVADIDFGGSITVGFFPAIPNAGDTVYDEAGKAWTVDSICFVRKQAVRQAEYSILIKTR